MRRPSTTRRPDLARRHRTAAAIGAACIVLITLVAFIKGDLFAPGFHLRAVFSSAAQIHPGSEVRIAGIQVGQVEGIGRGPHDTALVTLGIDADGLPIHHDATLTIRPRLVLEGNGYVDLNPGSPGVPSLDSGALIGERHTAIAVQLDRVIDTFDHPTRSALQNSVASLGQGLGSNGRQPAGWAALRGAVRSLDGALGPLGEVSDAAQGEHPRDLTRTLTSVAAITDQLAADPGGLSDLVSSYDTTFAALSQVDRSLGQSIGDFDALLRAAPAPLRVLDGALAPLARFAHHVDPVLRAIPASTPSLDRLLDRLDELAAPSRLPALLTHLEPVLSGLPTLEPRLQTLFGYTTPVTDCIVSNIVPALNEQVVDGVNSTGDPAYLDLAHALTGMTGFASAVDGNGGTARLGITTGNQIVNTTFPGLGRVVARLPNAEGVRPIWLGFGVDPPYRPDQPCSRQAVPHTAEQPGDLPDWMTGATLARRSHRS